MDAASHGPGHPSILILAPTRELALQTKEVVDNFDLYKAVCCYGGSSRFEQVNFIKRSRPPIIVGTPGRINDMMESISIDTDLIKYLGKYFNKVFGFYMHYIYLLLFYFYSARRSRSHVRHGQATTTPVRYKYNKKSFLFTLQVFIRKLHRSLTRLRIKSDKHFSFRLLGKEK